MSDKRIEIQEAFEKVIEEYKEYFNIYDVETAASDVVEFLCNGE